MSSSEEPRRFIIGSLPARAIFLHEEIGLLQVKAQ